MSAPRTSPAQLLAEIYADAEARRASGEIPADYEAALERAFVTVAPARAVGGDGRLMLDRAEAASVIHPHAPIVGSSRLGTLQKRLVRKATYWYVAWLTEHIADFAGAMARAASLLERRLTAVERGERRAARVDTELAALPVIPRGDDTVEQVLGALGTPDGKVLVGESGSGQLLRALDARHIRAEGIDPRIEVSLDALATGLTIHRDEVRDHLVATRAGSAAGVVLVDIVERAVPDLQIELADLAEQVLAPGGRLVIVSADPTAPATSRRTLEQDLTGGRPLHASTWRHLLEQRRFDDVRTLATSDGYLVVGTRST